MPYPRFSLVPFALGAVLLVACSDGGSDAGSSAGGGGSTSGPGGTGGDGGAPSGPGTAELDEILAALRADRDAAMLTTSRSFGFPVEVEGGMLFVSTDVSLDRLGGDHDAWKGTPMHAEAGFAWIVIDPPKGERYKFTDGTTWAADPWSRAYTYDDFGEISLAKPNEARLERHFAVHDATMTERTVRVWVPATEVSRVLYVHDGQNLFDPEAIWGGWHLQESAPPGMLVVGIDNTPARMDEYTPSRDVIGGSTMGGLGEAYADYVNETVRALVRKHYGEQGPIGTMGSSLGGLEAFLIADRFPGQYAFAASLSGTMGWGSIGSGVHHETILERFAAHGHQAPILYLDSGGQGPTCADTDHDGVDDDDEGSSDNYCETLQLKNELLANGYTEGEDVFYWWEEGATHDEASWSARVFRPLELFAEL